MLNSRFLSETYDLPQPIHIGPMTDVGRNNTLWAVQAGAEAYVLKQHTSASYDDRASIDYEYHLLSRLAAQEHSFMLPVPYLTRTGEHLCETEAGLFSLARHLPGTRFGSFADLAQVEAFGSALGELHTALATCPIESRPGRPLFELLLAFPVSVCDVFNLTSHDIGFADEPALRDILAWWRDEAHMLHAFSTERYRSLPWQMCHNDFTPANVLMESGRVSAVLDFEFSSPAARTFDVAMALRMTMRIWETPEPWDVIARFFAGYRRWIQLSEREIEALPWVLRLRCAMPIVWWIGRQQGLDRVPELMANHRAMVEWLGRFEGPFLERVAK